MAEAARARAAPLHRGLPDEISIWEILVRLPPKALLRCRAVCRAWRHATSARDFLLAHHGHQPALPLLYEHNPGPSIDIIPLDHRAGVATADKFHSVARLGFDETYIHLQASCDGLLIFCTEADSCFSAPLHFSVCSPATRQYAPLPLLRGFCLAGMYPHTPTGEYRLLLYPDSMLDYAELPPGVEGACYVYALGSCEPPRHIGWPEVELEIHAIVPALICGSLHWHIERDEYEGNKIIVFDTTTELFRQMRAPAVPGAADLFEMDGVLGMASFFGNGTVDIWTMQDYDGEVWAFKYRVELPVAELTERFGFNTYYSDVVVSFWDDHVLILVQSDEWLLHFDVAGKLVASFHRKLLRATQLRLKQTLVQHTFFPTIEGYVVNTFPFISLDDSGVHT
ncbi:hypothetical protein QYE76_057785 [Lolium multiflorum]|uniref:F-box domain-containing protein n=1 Tax=Lolium multiflorum TaxID=4521 RepID=A0AAD8WPD4_LOLMU|nr:hypothetical protein QYE76_057785 [Lolium multiflorum]